MGNESSTLLKLRRNSKEKDAAIIIECDGVRSGPLFRKHSKRSISHTRYAGERRITPPSEDGMGSRKNSGGNLRVNASFDSLCLPNDRRRSRSLCGAQIEKDAQVISVGASTPKEEKGGRKSSSGLVPSLNRIRIQQCYKTAKPSIGESILRRAAATRPELRAFFSRLNEESWNAMAQQMHALIEDSVMNIDKAEEVLSHARTFGESYATLCVLGFRPDLFAPLADAAIAECVKLDGGVHKRCDTLLAWSQLIGALFTAVRDGYYERVRYQRRSSLPQHTITKQLSMEISRSTEVQPKAQSAR